MNSFSGTYNQGDLPPELFNNVGTTTYNGVTYNVVNNGNGTRTITPTSGGGGSSGYTPYSFTWSDAQWAQARQNALNQLTPYYQQKLDLAKGDVELAKKYIEEDYQRGVRYYTGYYNTENTYNTQSYQSQMAAEQSRAQQEQYGAIADANQRGYYVGDMGKYTGGNSQAPTSNYYNKFVGQPLTAEQQARKQAIQLAYNRQSSLLGLQQQQQLGTDQQGNQMKDANGNPIEGELAATQNKALGEQDINYRNTQNELAQQKAQDVSNYAQQAYTQASEGAKAVNTATNS